MASGEVAAWYRELQAGAPWRPGGAGWGGEGREQGQEGDISILMADSCQCMAETSTTLSSNYPIKFKKNYQGMCVESGVFKYILQSLS